MLQHADERRVTLADLGRNRVLFVRVLALTKRAAAAEISPDMADRRNASVISGTSRVAMFWTPCSVAENDVIATAAAASVMIETAAKATGSLTLIPRPPIQRDSLPGDERARGRHCGSRLAARPTCHGWISSRFPRPSPPHSI